MTKVTEKVRHQYVPDEYYNIDAGIDVGNFSIVTRTIWRKFLGIWWPIGSQTLRFNIDGPFGWARCALGYTLSYDSDAWYTELRKVT